MKITKETKNYFMVFLLVFVSVSPLISNITRVIIISGLVLINIRYLLRIKINKKFIYLLLISFLFIVVAALDILNINEQNYSVLNMYFPACFILGYMLSKRFTLDEYLMYIDRIAIISAAFSIFGMIIIIYFPTILSYLPNYNYGGFTHKTAFVFNVLYADGFLVTRNSGFAREPGIYQMLLNFGMLATINKKNKWQLLKIIVYGVAIFLTKSTAGLIIYSFMLIKILKDVPKAKYLLLISVLLFSKDIYEAVIYQATYKLLGSNSFQSRGVPMFNAYNYGKNHIFGIGNTGYDAVYKLYNLGSWDSFSQVFLRYGYLMFGSIIYVLIQLMKRNFTLFIIILVTSLSQNIWYLVLITPIYFMSLENRNTKRMVIS